VHCAFVYSFDLDDLRSRVCAGEYSNRSPPDCEERGEKFHECLVCSAVDWWGGEPDLQRIAVQPADLCAARAWLDMYRKPNSAIDRRDPKRAHGIPNTPWMIFSKIHATIGVMSIIPIRGTTRWSGAIIQFVRTYDHRIHREYGEIGSHDEITRTRSASRSIPNPHDASVIPIVDGA
jgi:hypothetical protein